MLHLTYSLSLIIKIQIITLSMLFCEMKVIHLCLTWGCSKCQLNYYILARKGLFLLHKGQTFTKQFNYSIFTLQIIIFNFE